MKWKYRALIVLGVLVLFFIILVIDLFVHEMGHVVSAKYYGVSFEVDKFNAFDFGNEWGRGESQPINKEECLKFNSLPEEQRKSILHSGVWSEIVFQLLILITVGILAIVYGERLIQKDKIFFAIVILVLEIIPVVITGVTIYHNIFLAGVPSDWHVRLLDCSAY